MLSRRLFLALPAAISVQASAGAGHLDESFLDDLSRRAFLYFWEQSDPHTGLTLDRARDSGLKNDRPRRVASTATTGFGLTALCIGYERRWRDPEEILGRIRTSLRHLAYVQPHERGWFYHFVDMHSGDRVWNCEISTIDTALLLAGVLTAGQCFSEDGEIARMAEEIYNRVDFNWMVDSATGLLRMGWKPESGFLKWVWGKYRENAILHMLAIGSPTHPIPVECWYLFQRDPVDFGDYSYVGAGPLFTHQYSQAWLNLGGLRDGSPYFLDYFQNSVTATLAHRAFCLSLRSMYPSYSENLWGVSPSDSNIGYLSWGDAMSRRNFDGTIVPCAAAGSLMFTPEISLAALHEMYGQFGPYIYGRYGFADAFHPLTLWVNTDVIGIDQGITLLSAENLRTRRVWNWFSRQQDIRRAMDRIFETEAQFLGSS